MVVLVPEVAEVPDSVDDDAAVGFEGERYGWEERSEDVDASALATAVSHRARFRGPIINVDNGLDNDRVIGLFVVS